MTTSLFISVLLALLQSDLVKDKVLKPSDVVFRSSSITSVAALRRNSRIVLYFGTGTGLLIMALAPPVHIATHFGQGISCSRKIIVDHFENL